MKPLPIGMQCFADLRKGGYVYIDKTKEIHRMVSVGKTYFLWFYDFLCGIISKSP